MNKHSIVHTPHLLLTHSLNTLAVIQKHLSTLLKTLTFITHPQPHSTLASPKTENGFNYPNEYSGKLS